MLKWIGLAALVQLMIYVCLRGTVIGLKIVDAWNAMAEPDEKIEARTGWDYWRAAGLLSSRQPASPLLRERRRLLWALGATFVMMIALINL